MSMLKQKEYERIFGGEIAQQVKKTNELKKEYEEEMDKTIEIKAKEAKAIRIDSEYDELFGDLEKVLKQQTEKVDTVSKQYKVLFGELENILKEKVQHFTDRNNDHKKEYNVLFGDLENELMKYVKPEKEKEEKEEETEEEIKGIDDKPCIYRSKAEKVPCTKTEEECENEKLGTRVKHEPCPEIENKCEASGTSWGHTILNDMKTGNTPKWFEFLGDFLPPQVKLILAFFETFSVIAKNKDAIIKTGQKYIQSKITDNIKAVEKVIDKDEKDKDEKDEKVDEKDKDEKDKDEKVDEKDKDEKVDEKDKEEKVDEKVEKKGGGFTYEDCFF